MWTVLRRPVIWSLFSWRVILWPVLPGNILWCLSYWHLIARRPATRCLVVVCQTTSQRMAVRWPEVWWWPVTRYPVTRELGGLRDTRMMTGRALNPKVCRHWDSWTTRPQRSPLLMQKVSVRRLSPEADFWMSEKESPTGISERKSRSQSDSCHWHSQPPDW